PKVIAHQPIRTHGSCANRIDHAQFDRASPHNCGRDALIGTTSTLSTTRADALIGAIFTSAPDGIMTVDSSGLIQVCNTRAETLSGYEPGELTGRPVEDLLPASHRATHAQHRINYAAHPHIGPTCTGPEAAGRRKDGSEFPVAVSLSPLDSDDGPL